MYYHKDETLSNWKWWTFYFGFGRCLPLTARCLCSIIVCKVTNVKHCYHYRTETKTMPCTSRITEFNQKSFAIDTCFSFAMSQTIWMEIVLNLFKIYNELTYFTSYENWLYWICSSGEEPLQPDFCISWKQFVPNFTKEFKFTFISQMLGNRNMSQRWQSRNYIHWNCRIFRVFFFFFFFQSK